MADIGIVIVTCNSEDEIGSCLDAAARSESEVVVVDNSSRDRTHQEVIRRNVRWIANPENRGFAAAVNQGIRALQTPLILLLNPDAVLQTPIQPLAERCKEAGFASGKLVDAQGLPQSGFMFRRLPSVWALSFEALLLNRLWPRNPVNWHYRCMDISYAEPAEVEQPAGAFLMIRRDVWERLGGFDERFFPLWFEDVDFCKRARELGYRGYYIPWAVAKHTGGHSISKISLGKRELYWYGNLLRYATKHFRPSGRGVVCVAVILGSIPRMITGIAVQRSLQPIAVYGRVVRLAGQYLLFGRQTGKELFLIPDSG